MEKSNKKQRSKNLTDKEKEKLINVILKHKEIVENKETDKVNSQKKKATWLKIVNEFNAINSSKRSYEQIRNFYKNSKSDLRKQLSANRAANFRTGGGSREVVLDENNPLLSVVTEQTFSLPNEFDSSKDLFDIEHEGNNEDDSADSSPGNTKDYSANQDEMELVECTTEFSPGNPILRPSTGRTPKLKRKNEVEKEAEEITLLKRMKLEAEIEKTKLKCEVYRIKLKVLTSIENEYCKDK